LPRRKERKRKEGEFEEELKPDKDAIEDVLAEDAD